MRLASLASAGPKRGARRRVPLESLSVSLVLLALLVGLAEPSAAQLAEPLAKWNPSEPLAEDASGWSSDARRAEYEALANDRLGLREEPPPDDIFLLEDKDYPKSLFEDYSARVGQVSGITTLPSEHVVIFHRAGRVWDSQTRLPSANSSAQAEQQQLDKQLIGNDTLMIIERDTGKPLASLGAHLFYMPHSVSSDSSGNLWLSDVGRHQVMRLAASSLANHRQQQQQPLEPDIVLGQAFVAGQDEAHFCAPAEVAASSRGALVFVADGYCNSRLMVFTSEGRFVRSIGHSLGMRVVHSLALLERRNLVCAADRENERLLCFRAGLDGDLERLGELELELNYPIGRVFALAPISDHHLLVSSKSSNPDSNRYDLAILQPFTRELKLVWTSSDLLEPHSLASTHDRQLAYAADVSRDAFKKVFKFNIIVRK